MTEESIDDYAYDEEVEENNFELFSSIKEEKKWETYSLRKESMWYLYKRDEFSGELADMNCAVCISLYTTESWLMMAETRARKRDNGSVYGSLLPSLPYSKKIKTIYTLDWNIDTGRIMGIGSILDPRNTNPANTNGCSVCIFKPPYHFLNSYVYGGPKWVARENINSRVLPYIYMLEQLAHTNPLIRMQKKQTKEEYIYKKRGLFRIPISYFVHFDEMQRAESMFPVGIHELCMIILNE